MESSPKRPVDSDSFHSIAAGGYNGLLAKLYERQCDGKAIVKVYEEMKREGITMNITTYNYLIYGFLERKDHESAYRLIYQMEKENISPNLMTFEVLLSGLANVRGMGMVVEELFDLMRFKYEISPSISCWSSRVLAWIGKRSYKQAIRTYDTMLQEFPASRTSGHVHTNLLKTAVLRKVWYFGNHIVKYLRTTIAEPSDLIMVPLTDLKEIWDIPGLFNETNSLQIIRFLANAISKRGFEEGSALRLLYFASSCGGEAPDLADLAMSSLLRRYRDHDSKVANIPMNLLDAYISAIDLSCESTLVTDQMKSRLALFKSLRSNNTAAQ